MAGIVEAVSKELEPDDPFEDLVVDHWQTLSSKALSFLFVANSSWNTAWDYDLIDFVIFFSADSVSVKPWGCSKIINFTEVVSVYIHVL